MKDQVDMDASMSSSGMQSEIENTAKLLHPLNSSATNLARILSSSLNGSTLSQLAIQNKVAPMLFQTFSVIPHISQISYFGLEGPFFAYYRDGNETYAIYSNSSIAPSNSSALSLQIKCTWYKQAADPDTGKLYGNASESQANILANASWIQEALSSGNGHASIGNGWSSAQDIIFLNSVSILGQGAISLGFPVNAVINFFNAIEFYGGSLCLATVKGDVLSNGLPNTQLVITGKSISFNLMNSDGDHIDHIGKVSCMPNKGMLRPSLLKIGEAKYMAYCSQLEIMGVQSVYALAFPHHGVVSTVDRSTKVALILLLVMVVAVFISIFSFVVLMVRAATREIHLSSALIRQMEATQQAERKSMNKSLAFASASHDIRAALAGITGLIEISYGEVSPYELQTNLHQMDDCAKDLVGLLNSILDTSKVEAGKMQVELEEFDLANLLEDVVDLFHPVGMQKGLDVILDPCDGSVLKFSNVKGDRGKLKQVLCNLLGNAVKFTSEGHVSVRAWARKPSLEDKIIASSQKGLWRHCSCWFMEHKDHDAETMDSMKQNPNCMEFLFEVDDTGIGIPKEMQKSVFENFVQAKETAFGQGGTGLGLGIVQSLVRLMGGEIGIVDKENNEKGTCFKFNTFLITSEIPSTSYTRGDIEMGRDSISNKAHQYSELTVKAPTSFTSFAASPRLSILGSSLKIDGSHVVLLIQNKQRQRIVQKFIERLGIRISVVSKWERLSSTLTKIRSKQNVSPYSYSGKSDLGSRNEISSSRPKKDVPLSYLDGAEQKPLSHRSSSSILKGAPSFILLVIDTSTGPFEKLQQAITEFRRGLHSARCKVVWLDKPTLRRIHGGIEDDIIDSDDEISLKPFHGSRLYHVIRFLPEFGGTLHHGVSSSKPKRESTIRARKAIKDPGSSSAIKLQRRQHSLQEGHMVVEGSTIREHHKTTGQYPARKDSIGSSEIHDRECGNQSSDKPLSGVRFLVADDDQASRMVAKGNLSKLGASVKLCANGEEALELVRYGLQNQNKNRRYSVAPYDYILMDCEMPIMNGYEATRQIRLEERSYDIHMPVIALTADDDNGEKMEEAGMDDHLHKPLNRDQLLKAIGIKESI
ncbi:histidine kinase CKI1 [Ricinus communis]|uniref:histidine kinase CKI1 n=1 Tax=Ricinus communis TaxID=3988 RepID=UPI00201A990A|nr:histidine kinase CKI1 [Ricinus communis]